jgi:hypothetical protein
MIDFDDPMLPPSLKKMLGVIYYKDSIQQSLKKSKDPIVAQYKLNLKARFNFVAWHLTELRGENYLIKTLRSKYNFLSEDVDSPQWQVHFYAITSAIRWSAILWDHNSETSSLSGLINKARGWNDSFGVNAKDLDDLKDLTDSIRASEEIKRVMTYRNKVLLHVDVNEFLKVVFAAGSDGLDTGDLEIAQKRCEETLARFAELYFRNAVPLTKVELFPRKQELIDRLP